MFGFKRDVKKELNDIWAEIYTAQQKQIITNNWIDGFDERCAGFLEEIRQIETNYGDCMHNLEKDLNAFKEDALKYISRVDVHELSLEEIKNKLIPACNRMWNKQKLMEETQVKIIKVLNAMADKLDEETVKTIKNIQKKNKGE